MVRGGVMSTGGLEGEGREMGGGSGSPQSAGKRLEGVTRESHMCQRMYALRCLKTRMLERMRISNFVCGGLEEEVTAKQQNSCLGEQCCSVMCPTYSVHECMSYSRTLTFGTPSPSPRRGECRIPCAPPFSLQCLLLLHILLALNATPSLPAPCTLPSALIASPLSPPPSPPKKKHSDCCSKQQQRCTNSNACYGARRKA